MTTNTPDVIMYTLYDLIRRAVDDFVSSYEHLPESKGHLLLDELLKSLSTSNDVFIRDFAAKTAKDLNTVSDLVKGYDEAQLEHLKSLIPYYNESLENVDRFDRDRKEEFLLTFSFNIVRDVENVVEDERKIRKRWQELLYAETVEVDEQSTSLVYDPHIDG